MNIKESNKLNRSNSNQKGFTLIEVLVGLACSLIVLTTITGSLVFSTKLSNDLLNKSSNFYKIRNIKNYILEYYEDDDMVIVDSSGNGNIYYIDKSANSNKTIAFNTSITNIDINKKDESYSYKVNVEESDGLIKEEIRYKYTTCTIFYDEDTLKEYKFIIKENK